MKLLVCFLVVFSFIMACIVAVAFCGGMTFGTAPFGWLIGCGVFIAVFCGVGAASAVEDHDRRN